MRVSSPTPLGPRMVYRDRRTGQITRSVPYDQYLRGKNLQRKIRVKKAERNLLRRALSKVPLLNHALDAYDTMNDIRTIARKGKI